jgi:hypothetical protein
MISRRETRTGASVLTDCPEILEANLSYLYESCDPVRCRGTAPTIAALQVIGRAESIPAVGLSKLFIRGRQVD